MQLKTKEEMAELAPMLVQWVKDAVTAAGAKKVVVGISGGKDSAVVAALCAKAIGAENVIGVRLPNGQQSDIKDASLVIRRLKIEGRTINISRPFRAMMKAAGLPFAFEQVLDNPAQRQAWINLAPRLRMAALYLVAQAEPERALVIGTGNRSEAEVGYFTKWGDGAHDINPIGDLFKEEVQMLGHILGVPAKIVDKEPSDGLTGVSDENNMGFTYENIRQWAVGDETLAPETHAKIQAACNGSQHKRQACSGIPFPVVLR